MKVIELKNIDEQQLKKLLKRPSKDFANVASSVKKIVADVKLNGLQAALKYSKKYDAFKSKNVFVTKEEFADAEKIIPSEAKVALKKAYLNIHKFHKMQLPKSYKIEIEKGILCSRKYKSIESVGLYIPGGNAVLPSTVLMLGIPAKIAGCKRVVISTPVKEKDVNPYLLYAAKLCGISEVIKIGGAQGIALMAYGDKNFQKVNKIFGPGNQFVTYAKMLISQDPDAAQIDMPAGPSEMLLIADDSANPKFVASDLLSQAEHGVDSQVILITVSKKLAEEVKEEVKIQLKVLPRKEYAEKSLKNSLIIILNSLNDAVKISNFYAPEHLIINVKKPKKIVEKILNAGSVFLGQYSPESAGDYASGTNHSLPTNGLAKTTGGVSVEMFMKAMTFQTLTKKGLNNLADVIIRLAEIEGLTAHANAVKVRIENEC